MAPQSWDRMWAGLGVDPPPNEVFSRVLSAYQEPWRHYHTTQHLAEMLGNLADIPNVKSRWTVEAAIWFHHVEFDPRRPDNLLRSASFAETICKDAGVTNEKIRIIQDTIGIASHYGYVPITNDCCLFKDLDLGIFAAPKQRVLEYERQIRKEYSWMDDSKYAEMRKMALGYYLRKWRIYHTQYLYDRWESPARDALVMLIDALEKPAKK